MRQRGERDRTRRAALNYGRAWLSWPRGPARRLSVPVETGRIFASPQQGDGLWAIHELLIGGTTRVGYVVKGFGNDAEGNVYVAATKVLGPTGTSGTILKIVAPEGADGHGGSNGHGSDNGHGGQGGH